MDNPSNSKLSTISTTRTRSRMANLRTPFKVIWKLILKYQLSKTIKSRKSVSWLFFITNIFSDTVGYGATSVVFKASFYNDEVLDQDGKPKKETVAIKKVKNIFESDVYTHRVLRELRLLRILQGHNNVSK